MNASRSQTIEHPNGASEKRNVRFFDVSSLTETAGIRTRCTPVYLEKELRSVFPGEPLEVTSAEIHDSGKYANASQGLLMRLLFSGTVRDLPPFCAVNIRHRTGKHTEIITVWSPLRWNDRFIGTAGGGIGTGGENYITRPDNLSRGMTLPKAVQNGFTAATTDGALGKSNWAIDPKSGALNDELLENWHAKSTHFMTLVGKETARILHGRPVRFSYFHGGSGGGRQALVEAQEFPHDYEGIWASCPAIHWNRFVLGGLWPLAVMNSHQHRLSPRMIRFFTEAVHAGVGGKETYYQLRTGLDFDPMALIGRKVGKATVTEKDALVMREIWDGPRRKNGEKLFPFFRPGVVFWNVGIPIGAFYYSLFSGKPKPFFLTTFYARWITQNPKQSFDDITKDGFEALLDQSVAKFARIAADDPDLGDFARSGGKLLIDHGIDDPLIPVDGTLDYYRGVRETVRVSGGVESFLRLFITPGDGHGTCTWHGPGITESEGMKHLLDWVEKGTTPDRIRTVRTNRAGEILQEIVRLDHASAEALVWKNIRYGDRERNLLDLHLPDDLDKTKDQGLVVFIHGGGWCSFSKDGKTVDCERITRSGFLAATIGYTLLQVGMDPKTGAYTMQVSAQENVAVMLDEIGMALRKIKSLAEERGISISRIALAGDSSGAHLAMLYAYSRKDESPFPIAFVLNAVGPTDLRLFDEFPLREGERYALISALCGYPIDFSNRDSEEVRNRIDAISPARFAGPGVPPTLSAYGAKDDTVSPGNRMALEAALAEAGVPHEVLLFPNSGHALLDDWECTRRFFEKQVEYCRKYFR